MKTLIVDNYDSFTFNLYQLLAEVNGELPIVVRNDQPSWRDLEQIPFDNVVISPGPGRPENRRDFGVSRDIFLNSEVPILGVCLGCQGLAWVFGGKIVSAPEPVHGRTSPIHHDDRGIFSGLPNPITACRYHSLVVDESSLPECLEISARTNDGTIMGLRHTELPVVGLQFHPESILTEDGYDLLAAFLRQAEIAVREPLPARASELAPSAGPPS